MADALRAIARMAPAFAAAAAACTWSRPRRGCAPSRPSACAGQAARGTTRSTTCRAARCCCWPTSSSTRCRSASWSGAAAAGASATSRPARSSRPRRSAPPARDAARRRHGEVRGVRGRALAAALRPPRRRQRRRRLVPRLRPGAQRARRQPAGAARRRPADPLADPGEADLTAHVDFAALAAAARAPGPPCRDRSRKGRSWPASACSSARTPWPAPSRPPRRRADPGGPAAGRAGPHGPAVQGDGALPPCPPPCQDLPMTGLTDDRAARPRRSPPRALPPRHGFFTRRGGVQHRAVRQPELQPVRQRRPGHVRREPRPRRRALGLEPAAARADPGARRRVVTVTEPWPPGAGPRADALVTDRPGLALGIITADCAPVLLADPQAGVVGAVHAGWRGAVAGVLEATVAAMAALGASPRASSPPSAPASASHPTRWPPTCATPCWPATRLRPLLRRGRAAGRWQFDLRRLLRARRLAGLGRPAWTSCRRHRRRRRTASSATAAAPSPAAARSATRSRSIRPAVPSAR